MSKTFEKQFNVLGTKFDNILSVERIFQVFKKQTTNIEGTESYQVVTTNPEFVVRSQKDKELQNIINSSYLSVVDTIGIVIAYEFYTIIKKFDKYPLLAKTILLPTIWCLISIGITLRLIKSINKYSGSDLIYDFFDYANKNKLSMFLLGGRKRDNKGNTINTKDDTSQLVANYITQTYPNIRLVGFSSDFSFKYTDDRDCITYIKDCMKKASVSKLDMLIVAYPQFEQEKWIYRNKENIPVTLSIGVGRTFDYISGNMRKPNSFVIKYNLQWLYTLIKQPWRYKRIWNAVVVFSFLVVKNEILSKSK